MSADDAVVCLAGADASNDGKTVGSLGVITASTRIRTPQQAGQVLCQFRGKGDFREVFLELKRGRCTLKEEGRDGTLIAAASVIGASVRRHAIAGIWVAFFPESQR